MAPQDETILEPGSNLAIDLSICAEYNGYTVQSKNIRQSRLHKADHNGTVLNLLDGVATNQLSEIQRRLNSRADLLRDQSDSRRLCNVSISLVASDQ